MSLKDYAVMPLSDYVDACDAIRTKTETTESIKSADLKDKILSIKSESVQFASGTITTAGYSKSITISGLPFRPKVILIAANGGDTSDTFNYFQYLYIDTINSKVLLSYKNTDGEIIQKNTATSELSWTINDDGFVLTIGRYGNFYPVSKEKPWVCIG